MSVIATTDSDFKTALESNAKVIVKYYADWCGSCKLFAPKYKRLSDDERFQGITFLAINAEKNPDARKLAGVDTLPYFAVFKSGELVAGGSASKEDYVVGLLQKLN
ncbi:MAG: thioredoxin family protein [Chitinophagales bacterium]|nr:thioredoxin family protein [Chitinophagales bacterium]